MKIKNKIIFMELGSLEIVPSWRSKLAVWILPANTIKSVKIQEGYMFDIEEDRRGTSK